MKPTALAAAAATLALLTLGLSAVTGCHADPQDTHVTAPVVAPR